MELEEKHDGAVAAEIENATKNKAMIQQVYGFKTHGLVFFDAPRETVLDTMDGHLMKNEEIEAALDAVLASVRSAPPASDGAD